MIDIRQTDEFAEWFSNLRDRAAKLRITNRLLRVSGGNFGDFKSLGENLFELRFTYGPGYRVYFTRQDDEIVLLLTGGDKSKQVRDIKKAREILKGLNE